MKENRKIRGENKESRNHHKKDDDDDGYYYNYCKFVIVYDGLK